MVGYDDSVKSKSNEWRLHPASSEPNLRQSAINQDPIPPVPSLPNGANAARKSMAISRDKSLPPLPKDESPAFPTIADRPRTMYTYDSARTLPPGSRAPHDFLPPAAPFQAADSRRQSFGGLTARPNLLIQTPRAAPDNRQSLAPGYDEFGFSRQSLGRLDGDERNATMPLPNATKRKSKFGFASLLGHRKSAAKEAESCAGSEYSAHPFPTMGGGRYEENSPSSLEGQRMSRMSVVSRKPLNELVSQDPEFVAYRYPSTEHRLDILR